MTTMTIDEGTGVSLSELFANYFLRTVSGTDAPTRITNGQQRENALTFDAGTSSEVKEGPDLTRTSDDEPVMDLSWLAAAAEEDDVSTFIQLYEATAWQSCTAEQIANAVRLALSIGAHGVAQELAINGLGQHPKDAELRKMAHVLSPPEVRVVQGDKNTSWEQNRAWLRDNRNLYAEQWVALKNGELLATANSFARLIETLGELGETRDKDILLTQVD